MPGHEILTATLAAALLLFHGLGLVLIVHALMNVRTSQGTIAWIVSLLALPWIAVPMYYLTGKSRFSGYVRARRGEDADLRKLAEDMHQRLRHHEIKPDDAFGRAAEFLGGLPFTRGNELTLLIDGEETFEALFKSIASAQTYLLVNFFIVKNDRVGHRFKQALIDRAKAGVRVYFLYDELGSNKLSRAYLKELEAAGIKHAYFGSNRYWVSRVQLNFRNHRKIVVVDGKEAFVGGINVGDEYLGRDQRFGAWRDTHLKLRGPSVQAIQLVFIEDWNWAADEIPDLEWSGHAETADQIAAIIPTGPADPVESWQLVVAELANTARERLWIATPYFVPDGGVLTALQAASIRGVDVRILIPEKADHLLVWLSAFTYFEPAITCGIKLFRYTRGFLHQKVILSDQLACVGTANLDNRSFRLNFEISALSADPAFASDVAKMLENDFTLSREVKVDEFTSRPFLFRLACRAARLTAPVQ
ncbi:cardiolipin synthase [Luteolibacter soli]|uniref:Cardiolipin synthase n=1 Tax=Luteolibacter soli TaxID=3135280 RepID=A0ABU9AP89_9BACT